MEWVQHRRSLMSDLQIDLKTLNSMQAMNRFGQQMRNEMFATAPEEKGAVFQRTFGE